MKINQIKSVHQGSIHLTVHLYCMLPMHSVCIATLFATALRELCAGAEVRAEKVSGFVQAAGLHKA